MGIVSRENGGREGGGGRERDRYMYLVREGRRKESGGRRMSG